MTKIISARDYQIENYSQIPTLGGKILVIGIGGAGIPRASKILNENLKAALDYVPYVNTAAGVIDYTMLMQKDSADLTPEDVSTISKTIYDFQSDYDGFVVISGSDTIVYIASSTAFALNGLHLPVIFIGARQPANNIDSDFRLNLPNAIKTAVMGYDDVNAPSVGETGILFDDTLTRATVSTSRGLKVNNPIESPRLPKIAEVGWTIKVELIANPKKPPLTNFSNNTNKNLAYFDLVSQTNLDSFELLVEDNNVEGIIIGAFGAGNIPSSMIPLIHKAVFEKGKIIGAITNCKKGSSDMGLYDCGALAVKAGTLSLGPMVKPAAIEKMRWALNNARGEDRIKYQKDVARLLLTEIAGEIPTLYSKYAINQIKTTFLTKKVSLEEIYKKPEQKQYNQEIKRYCISGTSKHKILVVCLGGTFFMEKHLEGSLAPTKRTLKELFDRKLQGIDNLASIDYCELINLDSTELEHQDRKECAKLIANNMDNYDGFVVLHGTDTLAFSAGALSFMLQGLEKDIILTGAQKPGFDFSDFDRNFTNSIKVITSRLNQKEKNKIRAGVKLAFGDKLITGTTATKEDEHGLNAFAPLAKYPVAGILCNPIEFNDVITSKKRPFSLFTDFDLGVAYYECICAGDLKQFERLIENPKISSILIGGFDEGNMPLELKYYIATAVNSYEKPICFISNTDLGMAKLTNDGRHGEFIRAGAISLADMTKGAAFQKLQFAVGLAKKLNFSGRRKMEFIRRVMHTNLADEINDQNCEIAKSVYCGLFNEDKTKEMFLEEDIFKIILENSEIKK